MIHSRRIICAWELIFTAAAASAPAAVDDYVNNMMLRIAVSLNSVTGFDPTRIISFNAYP
jgi:hypothetical protein